MLKVIPLLFPLKGILNGRPYTYQWTSLLSMAYLGEGATRAVSDSGPSRWYALAEIGLALALFTAIVVALRSGRPKGEQSVPDQHPSNAPRR